jgi:MurNAc alpha-1-phosphate uridylyltransferase
MMLSAVILAGGLATRLRPTTETIPKSLIEIAGKPFICRQLEYLHTQKITNVVICIGYLGEMIKNVVGDGSKWGIDVEYSSDAPGLMGTGGAIKQALPLLGRFFYVIYGDSYLPINFFEVQKAFFEGNKAGIMTVFENKNEWDKSNVEFKDGKIIEYNKFNIRPSMHYIDYGLGILSSSAFDTHSFGVKFDLSEIYNYLSINDQLNGYQVFQRFYEIGSLKGIRDTQEYFLNKELRNS